MHGFRFHTSLLATEVVKGLPTSNTKPHTENTLKLDDLRLRHTEQESPSSRPKVHHNWYTVHQTRV